MRRVLMLLAVVSIVTAGLTSYVNPTMALNAASPTTPVTETEWINFELWFKDDAFV